MFLQTVSLQSVIEAKKAQWAREVAQLRLRNTLYVLSGLAFVTIIVLIVVFN